MTEQNVVEKYITLYFAEWCGHCITFKPEWFKFKQAYDKSKQEIFDKYKIKLVINEYESDTNPEKIAEAKVDGYPTIVIKYNDKTDIYIGPRNALGLFKKLLQKPDDEEINGWISKITSSEPLLGEVNYKSPQTGGFNQQLSSADPKLLFAESYRKYLKYKKKYDELTTKN